MKILILNSGEVRHIDNSTGTALVSAGLAEVVADLPAPPLLAEWAVLVIGEGGEHPCQALRMKLGQGVYFYTGNPKFINARKEWKDGGNWTNGFGREVPQAWVKAYAEAWEDGPRHEGRYEQTESLAMLHGRVPDPPLRGK